MNVPMRCFSCGSLLLFIFVFGMLSCLIIAALWSLAGKGLILGSLVCEAFLCFCDFPLWFPGSCVNIDSIDS